MELVEGLPPGVGDVLGDLGGGDVRGEADPALGRVGQPNLHGRCCLVGVSQEVMQSETSDLEVEVLMGRLVGIEQPMGGRVAYWGVPHVLGLVLHHLPLVVEYILVDPGQHACPALLELVDGEAEPAHPGDLAHLHRQLINSATRVVLLPGC